jgi:segregation and condensation protein A
VTGAPELVAIDSTPAVVANEAFPHLPHGSSRHVEFKVALDVFAGPLDLLLYLVKRHEVEIAEVPLSKITDDFLVYIEVLEALAIEQVGEFVELASVLLEIKARALVPRPEETEEPVEEVREDLVRRLLEYKQYRDAAVLLEDRARRQEQRFPRLDTSDDPGPAQPREVAFAEAQVWDLVAAMGRVMKKRQARVPRQIIHDDTPIEVHIERIEGMLLERPQLAFSELFEDEMPRMRVVGIFLAILELVRRGRVTTRQEQLFDELWLAPLKPGGPPAVGLHEPPPEGTP